MWLTNRRWFLVANLLLLLLYLWTLTEAVTVEVMYGAGKCRAFLPEQRTAEVGCTVGRVGVYQPAVAHWATAVLPTQASKWRHTANGFAVVVPENWSDTAQMSLVTVDQQAGRLTAVFPRLDDARGVLLLDKNGRSGWLLRVDSVARRAVWQRWQNGRLGDAVLGVPFQKPALAQFQTLLRHIVSSYPAVWLLLGVAWLVGHTRWPRPQVALTRPLLIATTLLIFCLTLLGASRVLERVPHAQDSVTYLFQAQTLARGQLYAPAPPIAEFFEQEFLLVRNGRWYGKYPPGFPAVLAIGVGLGVPWLINPLLATLTVPLLYQLGRLLFGRRTGLLAALLLAASPFFLILSSSFMAHAAELFWLTLFMVSWLRYLQGGKRPFRWLLFTGIAIGMAFLTRQLSAVAIGVPFMLLTMLPRWRQWRLLLRPLLLLGLLSAVFAGLLLAYQWQLTGYPWLDPRLQFWDYDRFGFGADVGESANVLTFAPFAGHSGQAVHWQTDPSQPLRGHTLARGFYNVDKNWQALVQTLLVGGAFVGLPLIWLALVWKRPSWSTWLLVGTAVCGLGAYIFYWHPGIFYGPRYFYAALPALLLLAARGLALLAPAGRTQFVLLLLIFSGWFIQAGPFIRFYQDFNFIDGEQLPAVVETTPQTPALIFVAREAGDWWEYGNYFSANTPWLDGPFIFARDLGEQRNEELRRLYPHHHTFKLQSGTLLNSQPQ